MTASYKVYRYSQTGSKKLVKKGLTLDEAQRYCRRPDTHGKTWFCGFTQE